MSELRQPAPDEEPDRATRPHRLGRVRLPEEGAVVLPYLVHVPESRDEDRYPDDGRERAGKPAALVRPRDGRNGEHDDDDTERPERPGTDELRQAERDAEPEQQGKAVVGANEDPCGEHEGGGRQQHRQRLRVEHRGRLHDDRARDEEHDRREVEQFPAGPEQADERAEEEERGDGRERVEDLPLRRPGWSSPGAPRARSPRRRSRRSRVACSSSRCCGSRPSLTRPFAYSRASAAS